MGKSCKVKKLKVLCRISFIVLNDVYLRTQCHMMFFFIVQSCTEMVMPMCTDGINDMFEPQPWNFQAFSDECYAQFGVRPRKDWAEIVYGGGKISAHSNIIFR